MQTLFFKLLLSVVLIAGAITQAAAERRVALVVGNSAYRHTIPLPNPRNDAADVGAALKALDFETIVAIDADKAGMDDAFRRFARLAREADVALFYYAGHGMQAAGSNYLLPVDAQLRDEADLPYEASKVDDVLAEINHARSVRIVVLDACRDNPLLDKLKSSRPSRSASISKGLARLERAQGFITAFATQPGHVAADGEGGSRNSPFTSAFLKYLSVPELEVGTFFRRVARDVNEATGGQQLPELSISLLGDFFFHSQQAERAKPRVEPDTSEAAQAWAQVKDSSDRTLLAAFVRRFEGSFFASLAQARLDAVARNVTNASPQVSDTVLKVYQEKYVPAQGHKAFAIAPDGKLYYATGAESPARAARVASYRCLMQHGLPCALWRVNDDVVLPEAGAVRSTADSVIRDMREPARDGFAKENHDAKVRPLKDVREGGPQSATPIAPPPGVKPISTRELARLIKTNPAAVVIDVATDDMVKKPLIPRALWVNGGGTVRAGQNVIIESNFAKAMARAAPDKQTPIVTYCVNWQCWLSWNAALRLARLGYTQVYWYRGGIEAWRAANLPFSEATLYAQVH
jgi:PQQ-dependent catabolism-associated CXXCW motif protein